MILRLMMSFLIAVWLAGCLSFGEDVETNSPAQKYIDRCRSEMFLQPTLELQPHWFKLLGSGQDDAMWLIFETSETDLSHLFDPAVIPAARFQGNFTFNYLGRNEAAWWDVGEKTFLGGQFDLPKNKVMQVGLEKRDYGTRVYIFWMEL